METEERKEDDEESLVQGVNELKVINERPIPMGSQEFQKALLECDLSRENSDEGPFRRRSHTIDSTYERNRTHSVSFASNLVSMKPVKQGSNEEMHPRGILRHHHEHLDIFNEENNIPTRRNTLDNTYKVRKKFLTKPEKSTGSDEKISKTSDKQNDSPAIHSTDKEAYSASGKSYHPNHFHTNGQASPRRTYGQGTTASHRVATENGDRTKSPSKVKLSQGVHS